MESQEILQHIRKQLADVESKGGTQVHLPAFKAYLDALEKGVSPSLEHRKMEYQGQLAEFEAESTRRIELLKAVLEAGKSALQALLLVNGGAVIALLGSMSNLVGKAAGGELARYLALPLLQFGLGVLCGALGFAVRYFSQACYSEGAEEGDLMTKWGDRLRYAAILVGISGYVCFGFGVVNAYHGFLWSFAP